MRDGDPVGGEQRVEEPAGGVPQGGAVGRSCFQSEVFSKIKEAAEDVELSGAAARKDTEIDAGRQWKEREC